MKHKDKEYTFVVGSDVDRDGMYLEVQEKQNKNAEILEIFYSDESHEITITQFTSDVPIEVVEWVISVAKERLPITKPQ